MLLLSVLCIPGDFNGQPFPGTQSLSRMQQLCNEYPWLTGTRDIFVEVVRKLGLVSCIPQQQPGSQAGVGANPLLPPAAISMQNDDGGDDDDGDAGDADKAIADSRAAVDNDLQSDDDDDNDNASGEETSASGSRPAAPWNSKETELAAEVGMLRRALNVLYRQSVSAPTRLPPINNPRNRVTPLPPPPTMMIPVLPPAVYTLGPISGGQSQHGVGYSGYVQQPFASPVAPAPMSPMQPSFVTQPVSWPPNTESEGHSQRRRGGILSCFGC